MDFAVGMDLFGKVLTQKLFTLHGIPSIAEELG